METIDLTSFEKAVNSLIEILERYKKEYYDKAIRDAVIQRFEYTYALALKMIRRYFTETSFAAQNENSFYEMTFNEIIRTANRMNLLRSNLEKWTEFKQKRNMTSHTYDENTAEQVTAIIPDFKDEALFLLNRLKDKLK